jgi:hypothetical protein
LKPSSKGSSRRQEFGAYIRAGIGPFIYKSREERQDTHKKKQGTTKENNHKTIEDNHKTRQSQDNHKTITRQISSLFFLLSREETKQDKRRQSQDKTITRQSQDNMTKGRP